MCRNSHATEKSPRVSKVKSLCTHEFAVWRAWKSPLRRGLVNCLQDPPQDQPPLTDSGLSTRLWRFRTMSRTKVVQLTEHRLLCQRSGFETCNVEFDFALEICGIFFHRRARAFARTRARLRARTRVCAHGFLVEGSARRCAQARNADVAATCPMGMSVFGSYQYLLKQKTEKQP